jgi:alkanesulfonate monooxygenase SsuD/methylene tetrahydromethanopterin reductase-like flavin-dependent oxidoreductase (luciferase family)
MVECLHALTLAALATRRCAIGSCVVQVPLRSPAALAKQATSLQLLSGGRFVLGVGSGSHPGEYRAAGVDYATRGRLLDEGLAALRRAWDSADTAANGTEPHNETGYRQLPASPPVPLWIGGSSATARRRAAATGDGWVPLFLEPDQLRPAFAQLRHETEDAGRDPGAVTPATVVPVHVGPAGTAAERGAAWLSSLYGIPPKAFARHLVAGSPATCAAGVAHYLDAGAHHVVLMVADDRAVEHFAALADALGTTPAAASSARAPESTTPAPAHLEVMA